MNGNEIHTLKRQTTTFASTGSARKSTFPKPRCSAITGRGLCGVATSQFHDVAETTVGTTQGRRSSTLNSPPAGMWVRRSRLIASPTSQEPNTPTTVKTTVKDVADQNEGWVRTSPKFF